MRVHPSLLGDLLPDGFEDTGWLDLDFIENGRVFGRVEISAQGWVTNAKMQILATSPANAPDAGIFFTPELGRVYSRTVGGQTTYYVLNNYYGPIRATGCGMSVSWGINNSNN